MIIHLNGWPGAGKKTIGQILAKNLNARFIHNHLLHDVAIICAGITHEDRWSLYETVRSAAYQILAQQPQTEIFVMTNALCKKAPREQEAWKHVVELAIKRKVPLIPIILQIDADENYKRIQSADRVGKKMTDAEELKNYFSLDALQIPDVSETFLLDVTHLSPENAAAAIETHIARVKSISHPASFQHLQMR